MPEKSSAAPVQSQRSAACLRTFSFIKKRKPSYSMVTTGRQTRTTMRSSTDERGTKIEVWSLEKVEDATDVASAVSLSLQPKAEPALRNSKKSTKGYSRVRDILTSELKERQDQQTGSAMHRKASIVLRNPLYCAHRARDQMSLTYDVFAEKTSRTLQGS